jgi:ABC-2 type transport system ATP-binding protein
MLLVKFDGGAYPRLPEELELTVRERNGDTTLFEHRGEIAALLRWLGSVPIQDVAIGTEDLRSLYDRFHGTNVPDEEEPV